MANGDNGSNEAMTIGNQHALALGNNETALAASASQAKAMVEARFVMAAHRPRDMDAVRLRILKDCKRPGFAESARYRRPVGKKKNEKTGFWEEQFAEGPSIRFAESALRSMGNVDIQTPTVYEDGDKRIIRCSVTDLETNATWSRDFTVSKTVERRSLKAGQKPLGTRQNSYGDNVYIVPATDSEVDVKSAAEISKSVRTLGLRLIPGDIIDEGMALCVTTLRAADTQDPDAARKKLVDGFDSIGVKPADLKAYLEHDIGSCSPAEMAELRAVFATIRDGETTWHALMQSRAEGPTVVPGAGDPAAPAADQSKSKSQQLKDSVKAKVAGTKPDLPAHDPKTGELLKTSAKDDDNEPEPPMGALKTDPKPAKEGA